MTASTSDARRRLVFVDLLCVLAGALVSVAVDRPLGIETSSGGPQALLVVFGMITLIHLGRAGQYEAGRRFERIDDVGTVLAACLTGAAFAVLGAALAGAEHEPTWLAARWVLVIGGSTTTSLLIGARVGGFHLQSNALREGGFLMRTLVVGDPDRARRFVAWTSRHPQHGVQALQSRLRPSDALPDAMATLTDEIARLDPDELLLALDDPTTTLRSAAAREARLRGVAVRVLPELFEHYFDMPFPPREGIPVATLYDAPERRLFRRVKYATDQLAAVLLLIALAPVLGVIAAAIRLEDGGPVIFAQERVGEFGSRFRVRKYRTMCVDAEQQRASLLDLNEADGPIFKVRDDPRVTRVGRMLRRTSLDELPQLWNVAFGEMSLVGPRPPIPAEVDEYRSSHRRRLLVRPGMTGLWQVSGRSDTTFEEMVDLDLEYIERQGPRLDLQILLRTVTVVLGRRGAY